MKKRSIGQTKLRFYCGLCQVPCRDENGYKCHLATDGHIEKSMKSDGSSKSFSLSKSDLEFKKKFIDRLITRHLGQTVFAYDIYRELFPGDRQHNALKATCWENLGTFAAFLKKEGKVEAEKAQKGWIVRVKELEEEAEEEVVEAPPKKLKVVHGRLDEPTLSKQLVSESVVIHKKPIIEPTNRLDATLISFSISKPKPAVANVLQSAFHPDSDSDS